MTDIRGTGAFVTGAAGLIGRVVVQRLSAAGAVVLAADLDLSATEATLVDLPDVLCASVDVTDEADVGEALSKLADIAEPRIVINLAGVAIVQRIIDRQGTTHSLASFRRVLEVNLLGTFNVLTQAAALMSTLSALDDGERGVIINTASVAGLEGSAGQAAYGAAKGGVVALTLPAARDLSTIGVRVVTIAPGGVEDANNIQDSVMRQQLLSQQAFPKRFPTPDEYASLAEHVIVNRALNGVTIRLDGGLRLGLK